MSGPINTEALSPDLPEKQLEMLSAVVTQVGGAVWECLANSGSWCVLSVLKVLYIYSGHIHIASGC